MIYTIISGSSREKSYSEKVAKAYKLILKNRGIEAEILTLYGRNILDRDADFIEMENKYLIPTEKFIFILPEYNGSYPGVLKAMIDNSDIKKDWWWKKALLTGVSTGRAGNLRGMDHLTGTLQYMKMIVHPNKLPISVVDTVFDENFIINHEPTCSAIRGQLDEFISF